MKTALHKSESCEDTWRIAASFGASLSPGSVVALFGELGAGKTRFVQGLASAWDVQDVVSSPTFTLVNEYRGRVPVYHIDLYRIRHEEEALDLGLDEYLFGRGITIIEWSERILHLLPDSAWRIHITPTDEENGRTIEIREPA